MKKSILATSLACALGVSAGSHAYNLKIDGELMDGANVNDISLDSGTNTISINTAEGSSKIGLVDGTSDGSTSNDGTSDDGTTDDGTTDDGTSDDGTTDDGSTDDGTSDSCDNAPSDVVCTTAWTWPDGESKTSVTIPQGKTLSTPFTTTLNDGLRGVVTFEARSDTTPNTDIWISTTPGGSTYTDGTYNNYYCQQRDESFKYSIRWYQNDSSRGCSLETGQQYYFNIRHSSDNTSQSYTHRWRTYDE